MRHLPCSLPTCFLYLYVDFSQHDRMHLTRLDDTLCLSFLRVTEGFSHSLCANLQWFDWITMSLSKRHFYSFHPSGMSVIIQTVEVY